MMYSKHLKSLLFLGLCLFSTGILAKSHIGITSWYGHPHHGKKTASGERYNMYGLSAAHRSIKLGTIVKVTNLKNHKSVVVKINDRGPFVKGRVLDLSYAAAKQIGVNGTAQVKIEILH